MRTLKLYFVCFIAICSTLLFSNAKAQVYKIAVLELNNKAGLSEAENSYLTDCVRVAIKRSFIGTESVMIMTRESIQELLPPDVRFSDCSDAECEVGIGRMIGADYLVSGDILDFAGELRLNLKLHHCKSAQFLDAFVARGEDPLAIEKSIQEPAMMLARMIFKTIGAPSHGSGDISMESVVGDVNYNTEVFEKKAVVSFDSEPQGAVVIMDGRMICSHTPCRAEVPMGRHKVSMQMERYIPAETALIVEKLDDGLECMIRLQPDFGWITIRSAPEGVQVKVDGILVGKTPLIDLELPPGTHKVEADDPRYIRSWKNVAIERNKNEKLDFVLTPREGSLYISGVAEDGYPVAGKVLIDGLDKGKTPWSGSLPVGKHDIEVLYMDKGWKGQMDIKEGKKESIKIKLEDLKPKLGIQNLKYGDRLRIKSDGVQGIFVYQGLSNGVLTLSPEKGGVSRRMSARSMDKIELSKGNSRIRSAGKGMMVGVGACIGAGILILAEEGEVSDDDANNFFALAIMSVCVSAVVGVVINDYEVWERLDVEEPLQLGSVKVEGNKFVLFSKRF